MKVKVVTLENKAAGEIDLDEAIFGLPERKDLLQRAVEWQRAKKRAGTHKVKDRAEVSGTGQKPFRQKGSGRARAGTLRASQHEGGGVAIGPGLRSHAYSLPKKVRSLALKTALSVKQAKGELFVLDALEVKAAKTKDMADKFAKLGLSKPLFIDGAQVNEGFAKAARNLKGVDVLPTQGANVYDILRHKELVLTKASVEALQARLRG